MLTKHFLSTSTMILCYNLYSLTKHCKHCCRIYIFILKFSFFFSFFYFYLWYIFLWTPDVTTTVDCLLLLLPRGSLKFHIVRSDVCSRQDATTIALKHSRDLSGLIYTTLYSEKWHKPSKKAELAFYCLI